MLFGGGGGFQLFGASIAAECLAAVLSERYRCSNKEERSLIFGTLAPVLNPNSMQQYFVICYANQNARMQAAATAQVPRVHVDNVWEALPPLTVRCSVSASGAVEPAVRRCAELRQALGQFVGRRRRRPKLRVRLARLPPQGSQRADERVKGLGHPSKCNEVAAAGAETRCMFVSCAAYHLLVAITCAGLPARRERRREPTGSGTWSRRGQGTFCSFRGMRNYSVRSFLCQNTSHATMPLLTFACVVCRTPRRSCRICCYLRCNY